MTGDYTSERYRKMRAQFRHDCRRNRLPCSICRQPIDYDLKYPHGRAWELHHIQPSSTAPHLHYVRGNWAPAHSRCNKSHGDKPQQKWVQPNW